MNLAPSTASFATAHVRGGSGSDSAVTVTKEEKETPVRASSATPDLAPVVTINKTYSRRAELYELGMCDKLVQLFQKFHASAVVLQWSCR